MSAGWRMPADFAPHDCAWIAWLNENQNLGYTLECEWTFQELTGVLKGYEPLRIRAWDEAQADHIKRVPWRPREDSNL